MDNFISKVLLAMNSSNISVSLKIEGTSQLHGLWPYDAPSDEIPFHFESTDVWTANIKSSEPPEWGAMDSFERRCYDDHPSGSKNESELSIIHYYMGDDSHRFWDMERRDRVAGTQNQWDTKTWSLSIETFGVTPIQKGHPHPIGICDTPSLDRQGVFASFDNFNFFF